MVVIVGGTADRDAARSWRVFNCLAMIGWTPWCLRRKHLHSHPRETPQIAMKENSNYPPLALPNSATQGL